MVAPRVDRRAFVAGIFTALAAVSLLLAQGCAGVDRSPWLDAHLTEEFTARKADDVRTLDEYLALEQRLFAQLDSKVYAVAPTGPGNELLRYSAGSAADPRSWQPNWNHTFELPAADPAGGVLLLHGMSDSPYSLRALGEALHREGYHVIGLRLPGHGTAPSGLKYVRWEDMAAAVRIAMGHLSTRLGAKPIHLVGYSTGASLALNFSLDALDGRDAPVPASLILISPAIGIHGAAALAGWKRRASGLPGMGNLAWLIVEPEFDPYKYNSFATNAGEQVHRLTRSVSQRIASRARAGGLANFPPTLVFKSNADSTVTNQAVVDRLLAQLAAHRNELVLFDVNRLAAKEVFQIYDRRALTLSVIGDARLPFAVTIVTNESADTAAVEARRQPPFSATFAATEPLGMNWPPTVISLSHVAVPIPPDDPLYGVRPPDSEQTLYLGQIAFQGERGYFAISADWLLRMRHNPFYAFLEKTAVDWAKNHAVRPPDTSN
jgi:alpha-beta hydrolase superfamily lysophospholipase